MISVYVFDRGDTPLPAEAALLLPAWRRERYARLRYGPARQESLGAGLLYAHALRAHGLSPEEPVRVLPAGKPVLAAREGLFFSLSHSDRYMLCAVSDAPVGADVQRMRPVKLSLARRFHPAERDWLSRLPEEEREGAFYRLWTRKEAWVKAVSGDRLLSLDEADVIHRLPGLLFRDYVLEGGYRAAVCAAQAPPALTPVGLDELTEGLPPLAGGQWNENEITSGGKTV